MTSLEEQKIIADEFIGFIGEKFLVQNPGALVVRSLADDQIGLTANSDELYNFEGDNVNDLTILPIAVSMEVKHSPDTGFSRGVIEIFSPQTILEMIDLNHPKHTLRLIVESSNRGNDNLPSLTQINTEKEYFIRAETNPPSPDPFAAAAELLESILAREYIEATGLTLEDMEGVRDYHRNPAFNKPLSLLEIFNLVQ